MYTEMDTREELSVIPGTLFVPKAITGDGISATDCGYPVDKNGSILTRQTHNVLFKNDETYKVFRIIGYEEKVRIDSVINGSMESIILSAEEYQKAVITPSYEQMTEKNNSKDAEECEK